MNHDDRPACNGDFPDLHAVAEQDALQALGMLSSGIAHEINTPLGAIGCAASTQRMAWDRFQVRLRELAPEVLDDVEIRRAAEAVRESDRIVVAGMERVMELVNHMRRFLSKESAQTGPVDVAEMIDGALLLASYQLRGRVEVVRDYADVPRALGHPNYVGQILLNLVVNASQALGPEGGRLILRASATDTQVLVEVADDGPGVPPEVGDRVFEFGFTTRADAGGTGFGLSLSRHLAGHMDGDLSVGSAPEGGALFTLRLPRFADPS